MILPIIAIVGRPNVGKSTLFNRLTKTRDALVADVPGLTRDRQYGEGNFEDWRFIVIDTGGIGEEEVDVDDLMSQQSLQAAQEADVVFFVVDGRAGLTPIDQKIAHHLRQLKKTIHLVVNKVDGIDSDVASSDFYQLGMGEVHPITASHGRGIGSLLEDSLSPLPTFNKDEDEDSNKGIAIAIVGRPNVGKSTLVNRMLGEDRVVVYDMPGTTRDSISISFEREDKPYTLIDTAGVRRRGRVKEVVEKFSVVKTLQSIERSQVCIVLLNAQEGVTDQDMHLISFVIDAGKALVLAVNKWDGMSSEDKESVKKQIDRRLAFADFAKLFFISALHGSGVGTLFPAIEQAYASATRVLSTPELTRILESAVDSHPPPMVNGHRVKLRYAHVGGHNPPIIVIHGTRTKALLESYKRYLMNTFRRVLNLSGTPIRIELRSGANPYKDKKTVLSQRQVQKKQRMMKHIKKKK